jgi:hypothetical protein
MRKTIFALLLCGTALAQEHPPSAQQCVADANAWYALGINQSAQSALDALSFGELGRRTEEMRACGLSAAPIPHFRENPLMEDYAWISSIFADQQRSRMAAYIKRHRLGNEFLAEDAAGQR